MHGTGQERGNCVCLSAVIQSKQKGGDCVGKVKIKLNQKALEKTLVEAAKEKASEMSFDVKCPHCGAQVTIPAGISVCPACGNQIDLKVNINF